MLDFLQTAHSGKTSQASDGRLVTSGKNSPYKNQTLASRNHVLYTVRIKKNTPPPNMVMQKILLHDNVESIQIVVLITNALGVL